MSPKTKNLLGALFILLVLGLSGYVFWRNNIGRDSDKFPRSSEGEVLAGFDVPADLSFGIFAEDVPGARVIILDPMGRLIVSETTEGRIVALLDTDGDGKADENKTLASRLNKPHGLVLRCEPACFLYVAEHDSLSRYAYDEKTATLGQKENLISIAASSEDRHYTRSLLFLPAPNEDTLLISAGSSCDVCIEKDEEHAAIISYNIQTGKKEIYAKGLRNATYLARSAEGLVFASEMGRDNLGDDLPPDEINIIEPGKNYGWPICYGKNIHDEEFDKNTYIRDPCTEPFETPSFIDLPAHSAPLGLGFIPAGSDWPEEYWHDLLVAYRGSWNRSVPTGYKVVRLRFDAAGEYQGTEDFITGWLAASPPAQAGDKSEEKLGRPTGILILPGGEAYIADDSRGVIYRLGVRQSRQSN